MFHVNCHLVGADQKPFMLGTSPILQQIVTILDKSHIGELDMQKSSSWKVVQGFRYKFQHG